jgi:hypothetical protein
MGRSSSCLMPFTDGKADFKSTVWLGEGYLNSVNADSRPAPGFRRSRMK